MSNEPVTPEEILGVLDNSVKNKRNVGFTPEAAAWILAQLKHKDDRIAALTKLIKPTPASVSSTPAETVCQEADRITSTERQGDYGHPVFNFTRTARLWEVVLDRPAGEITPEQVGLCMLQVKVARHLHKPKRDNLVDVCGYAKATQMCSDYQAEDRT